MRPLVSSFSSTKLVLVFFVVCVCCLWFLPSFSFNSSLSSFTSVFSSTVVSSAMSSSISFFLPSFTSYRLSIRMIHIDYQFVRTIRIDNPYNPYGFPIHIFNTEKNTEKAELTTAILEWRWTPTMTRHCLMKTNQKLKRRKWENLRGEWKWREWCSGWISNLYFKFKLNE